MFVDGLYQGVGPQGTDSSGIKFKVYRFFRAEIYLDTANVFWESSLVNPEPYTSARGGLGKPSFNSNEAAGLVEIALRLDLGCNGKWSIAER